MNDLIPLNPEHSLGYYLSTRSHDNQKTEIMKDCLSLVRMSDELWVFVKEENENTLPLNALPEGVMIELLLWAQMTGGSPVRVLSIPKVMMALRRSESYVGVCRSFSEQEIKNCFDSRFFLEISNFLFRAKPSLRPVLLIDIDNNDFKYADWARAYSYKTGFVPLLPQLIIPEMVYGRHELEYRHNEDRETLCGSVAKIMAIFRSKKDLKDLKEKYVFFQETVDFVPIQRLDIPKYTNPSSWSITSKEYGDSVDLLKRT